MSTSATLNRIIASLPPNVSAADIDTFIDCLAFELKAHLPDEHEAKSQQLDNDIIRRGRGKIIRSGRGKVSETQSVIKTIRQLMAERSQKRGTMHCR